MSFAWQAPTRLSRRTLTPESFEVTISPSKEFKPLPESLAEAAAVTIYVLGSLGIRLALGLAPSGQLRDIHAESRPEGRLAGRDRGALRGRGTESLGSVAGLRAATTKDGSDLVHESGHAAPGYPAKRGPNG
jgi:hypothetical protein